VLVWLVELVWFARMTDAPLAATLMALFLFTRALAFPPGIAILGRRLPSADARFDYSTPVLCAMIAGTGPLALTTSAFLTYLAEVFTRAQRIDRAAFNAAKIAIAGALATLAVFGASPPRIWTPLTDPGRFAVIALTFALCDAVISASVASLRENRPPGLFVMRSAIDAGMHWDVLGGLVGGFAIVYVYARLGIVTAVALGAIISALVWMDCRVRTLRAELARMRSHVAALTIAEPQDVLGRKTQEALGQLHEHLGLDLLALYAPAPGEHALTLLAGTGSAPARIPLVAENGGPLERALAGEAAELADFRASGSAALVPGTERWRATLALPLAAGGNVIAVLLATRATPFLPPPEGRARLRDAASQLAEILSARLAAEERLRLRSQEIYRDVIAAATGGKLELVTREELERDLAPLRRVDEVMVGVPHDVRLARVAAERAAIANGLGAARVHDLVLCVSETATNVLKHAGRGELQLLCDGERLVACVRDSGPGIPFAQLPKATLMRGFSSKLSLGYGFTFLLEFLDHIRLATGTWGTIVAMEVLLRPREDLDELLARFGFEEDGTLPGYST